MCHSKTRSSRGEVPWHSILWQLPHWRQLCTDSCHNSGCRCTRPVHWNLSLPLAKLRHVFCPNTALLFGSTTKNWPWVMMTHSVFAKGRSKITRQSRLIGILCHPVCFTVALLLILELTTMCNLSWWVPCVDQPQKHNPSQWLGVMPINVCFFFCLLNEMCYFAPSLLTHTFLKQQIMWMFTVYGLVFFCYSPRK